MTPEQYDFCKMINHRHVQMQLEDLLEETVVVRDPWEIRNILGSEREGFLAVIFEDRREEHYAGRPIVMKPCAPYPVQIWAGEGIPHPHSDVRCLLFDDPDYNNAFEMEIHDDY